MDITKNVSRYVQQNGITFRFISMKTGLSEKIISSSLKKNGTRKLRADEFFLICDAINADPMEVSNYRFLDSQTSKNTGQIKNQTESLSFEGR